MKHNLTLLLTFLISIYSYGQNLDFPKMTETDSLYLTALEKYILEIDSFYNKHSEEKFPKKIFIEAQDYLLFLPSQVNEYKIQKVGLGNRKSIFRQNKNELILVKIFPLTLEEGRFRITLIPYHAELKRKNLSLGLSDWTLIYFKFVDGRLEYEETENGGI